MQKHLPPKSYLLTVLVISGSYFALAAVSTALPVKIGGVFLAIAALAATIFHTQLLRTAESNRLVRRRPGKSIQPGFFQYSHKPKYLGFALSILGWALAFSSPLGWIALGVFVFISLPAIYPL